MPSVPTSGKRWTCRKCQVVRAKGQGELCPVCWLVDELAREHRDGEHVDKFNSSCVACTRKANSVILPPQRHDDCDHPKTREARARCRQLRRQNSK